MTFLNIHFMEEMKKAIIEGHKDCTSRRIPYGKVGDVFLVFHEGGRIAKCTLTAITKRTLADVTSHFYQREGFPSQADFIRKWCDIHPKRGYIPSDQVWLHEFSVQFEKKGENKP